MLLDYGVSGRERPARPPGAGEGPRPGQPTEKALRSAVWKVEGTVVDGRGQAVAGAVVRSMPANAAVDQTKTRPDGTFVLPMGGRRFYIRGVVAEMDDGARLGLVRFPDGRGLARQIR